MEEKKYFILNEFGEAVRVEKGEGEEMQHGLAPKFKTPEAIETRRKIIDSVIEDLNEENLTNEEYSEIRKDVKVNIQDDIEKEDRERLDDDKKSFSTPQQQGDLNEKEAKIQRIKEYLNALNLKEEEMVRLDNEVKIVNKENSQEKNTEEKENDR